MVSEYNNAQAKEQLLEELKQFARDVLRMRWQQRAYFKTRDHYDLLDAKRWEKIVDKQIDNLTQTEQI